MLNKTNPFETNKSTKTFTEKIFPDKHTIEQLNRKNIPSIRNHSIQMFKETLKIQQNLNNNWPNITIGLNTIKHYVNQILKDNEQIKQFLKDIPDATNTSKRDTPFKQATLQQTKQMIEVLNKTNALETNKSTEKFTEKTFPDAHTTQQLNQKHIQSIEDHSIQMFKETFEIQQNLKNKAPNIREKLNSIQDYINRILEQTRQITEILKNKPDATNALKTDTSSQQVTLEHAKHFIEVLNKTNTLETNKSTQKFTQKNFPNKHTDEQLYQKTIQSIQDLSIQMFKETLNIQQNLKNKAPDITHTLNTIKKYVDQILKETGHIKEILKNMPDATKALQIDATFDETKQNEKHKTQQHFQRKTQTTSKQQ